MGSICTLNHGAQLRVPHPCLLAGGTHRACRGRQRGKEWVLRFLASRKPHLKAMCAWSVCFICDKWIGHRFTWVLKPHPGGFSQAAKFKHSSANESVLRCTETIKVDMCLRWRCDKDLHKRRNVLLSVALWLPGPMPTLMMSAPARISSSTISPVTTFPAWAR